MCVVNVASYDNYMLINSYLTFCFLLFAFFYDNLIEIRCILKQWIISEYPALFTDSPPVPPRDRHQTRVSFEQTGFAAVTNKEVSQLIIKLFPKYTKKVTKFGVEVLTGKALSF